MSDLPGFNEIFHPYYDKFSMHADDISIPAHFDMFTPDNQDDYDCISVICPSVIRGAKRWTMNGRWITIGIYRDEGRPAAQRPAQAGISWIRTGAMIALTDPSGHKLRQGDVVDLWNINIPMMNDVVVAEIVDSMTFKVRGTVLGASSGNAAAYQSTTKTDFSQDYRVFRLLPSFKLIEISLLEHLFNETSPVESAVMRSMYDITSQSDVPVPHQKSSMVNYELPTKSLPKTEKLALPRRFNQVYDEAGDPLALKYQDSGQVAPSSGVTSRFQNTEALHLPPLVVEGSTANDSRIYAYDYYGLDLNDPTRGPYFSSTIVTRDSSVTGDIGNIKIATNNSSDRLYTSTVNDQYGNLAIGIQANNSLIVRKQILPLVLDNFNKPVKSPVRR